MFIACTLSLSTFGFGTKNPHSDGECVSLWVYGGGRRWYLVVVYL